MRQLSDVGTIIIFSLQRIRLMSKVPEITQLIGTRGVAPPLQLLWKGYQAFVTQWPSQPQPWLWGRWQWGGPRAALTLGSEPEGSR